MKNIFLCIMALFAVNVFSQENQTDLQELNLKGKVKSVRSVDYEAVEVSGEVVKGRIVEDNFFAYNEAGSVVEKTKYYADGTPCEKFIVTYDSEGRVIEGCMYNSEGKIDFKKVITYDNKGNKLTENESNEKGEVRVKESFKYDDKNNLINKDTQFFDGNLDAKTVFEYDKKGNLIKQHLYREGSWLTEIYSKRIENGITIKEIQSKSEKQKKEKKILKYNDKGNVIEESEYDAKGNLLERITYKYDAEGREIEVNWENPNGFLVYSKYIKTYNDRGILSGVKYVYPNGNIEQYVYSYEYDNQGNWIKKILYINDRPSITERKIEYYE